ncbi:class I SAM-dependent methyltransferase [Nodularia harveyana UHCC-0300]|uniref:Class I SAM-dependent methyltransferase n=1 Tax=Nodularia harveyana UHCC-0300 TaxID=2974287 RepID=A0ABU5UA69_9CYAN|nr:class I SAM-dependent methyltransferase [Nodularia harveyana]MEA5580420.1 class I SAM-dependent methyltransferase [Nodularia harveyana UHCC-0300]
MGYFDTLIDKFAEDQQLEKAFGQHIHWGYWENPSQSQGTLLDFGIAANNLSKKVIQLSEISDGASILDVGCGFGGTISMLNNDFSQLNLVGVNIDEAQVIRAREIIQPKNDNRVEFVCANACELPKFQHLFDYAIALECIFAFPSREIFFQEVRKNLKPGGKLIVVDFIINEKINRLWQQLEKQVLNRLITDTYGSKATNNIKFIGLNDYKNIGKKTGFALEEVVNINKNVQPTYSVINKLIVNSFYDWVTATGLEYFSLFDLITYEILLFK